MSRYMSRRTDRFNSIMRRDLSELLLTEVKDPRVSGFVSVTRVDTSIDYQFAKVYVSVYGTLQEKQNTIDALQSASGFLRRQLRGRLQTRQVPAMRFMLDDTLAEGNQMLDLLDSLADQMPDSSESPAQQ
jgi:ribosome-binding factor A